MLPRGGVLEAQALGVQGRPAQDAYELLCPIPPAAQGRANCFGWRARHSCFACGRVGTAASDVDMCTTALCARGLV